MRTIKRGVLPLNQEKQEIVKGLCQAYCKEKRYWLGVLQSWDNQALLGSVREIRDQSVKSAYKSPFITEDLRHTFSYNKPKTVNRKLASWLRGTLQDRVEFKALAEGFRHEQVNPAYGSQICLNCGFVDNKNRKGDKFTCLYCRYEDIADRVAAVNYANRYADQEIGRRMPVLEVKAHLLEKFHRRLETGNIPVTVPGRTLDTDIHGNPPHVSRQKIVTAGRVKLVNQTVTQRAKQNKYV